MKHTGLRYFIAFLLLISSGYTALYAQVPGRVDTTFTRASGLGLMATGTYVLDGLELSDGSVVVVGTFTVSGDKAVGRIARLNSDGTTDNTFNSGGVGANNSIQTIVRQADGKYIIGGEFTTYNGVARNRIARINADGSLDATFNVGTGCNNTVLNLYLPCDSIGCDSVVMVSGLFSTYNGTAVSSIVRVKMNGTRDATFGNYTNNVGYIYSVAKQSTGKYIIGGTGGNSATSLKRLNADGSVDASFNASGLGTRSSNNQNWVYAVHVLTNDKIIVGGNFYIYDDSTSTDSTTGRIIGLNSNGTRDASFNTGAGFSGDVRYIYQDENKKLVIVGAFATYKGVSINSIVRIDTTGGRDSTFAVGTGLSERGFGVFKGTGNKLYAIGAFINYNLTARWGIVRIGTNGTLDNTFAAETRINERVLDVAVQSDGKIILAGDFTRYNTSDVGRITRLNADGTRDAGFNVSGVGANARIRTVEVLPSGKILIGGDFGTYNGTSRSRIALLNSDGSLDNTAFTTGANNVVTDIKIAPNGKIYICGNFGSFAGASRSRLVCLNPNFSVNSSGIGSKTTNATIYNIGIQDNNKILITGGFSTYDGVAHGCLIRIDTTGVVDTTFHKGTGSATNLNSIEFQKDGKILISSQNITYNGVSKGCFARLNADGSLDNTYASTHTGNYYGGYSMTQLGSGILVGGDHFTLNGQANVGFGYVNSSGSANTEFYQAGGIGGIYGGVVSRIIPDNKRGRILVAGEFSTIQNKLSPYIASLDNLINELEINTSLCAGSTSKLYYNKGVTFGSGNIFTVQLSNSSGSFASPVTIGIDTTDGSGPDSVLVTIPWGTAYGTGYKVRVVSTSPVFTSLASWPITITAAPLQKTVLQAATDVYPSLTTQIKVVASQTGVHYSLMNDTTVVDTGSGTGDTLRLYTNGIYNTTDFTIIAQASGCSRILDTVIVDTLGLIPVSWQLEGITESPDHSLHTIPDNGKPEAKGYNLMRPGQNGAVLYRFESGDNYEGMFGLVNPEGDGEYFFINALTVDTGKWDSTGLYFAINKDDVIYLRPAITSNVDVLLKKTGTSLGVYFNGLLDTTIVWPDTVSFSPLVSPFEGTGSVSGVYSSYGAILHGTVSAQNINCGDKGNASASISGGSPPYHFHWSNGDTTSTPDSLLVGRYIVTVTDFVNDTLVDSVEISYNGLIDTIGNVEPDSLGRLVSVNNVGPYSSYVWYTNSLPDGEDGWLDYVIQKGTTFQGYMGFGSNKYFDETTRGVGILILGNDVYATGKDFDMTSLGWYEPGEEYKFRIRFDDDNVYFSKLEDHGGGMEMGIPFDRGSDFRPGVVPMANGSVLPNLGTSFGCDAMFTNVTVLPAETMNDQATIRVDVKGGKSPYTYLWSNAATTAVVNVSPGSYTVTITDQNSNTITAQVFAGTYVDWLAANNVEETVEHEIVCTENIPAGYSMQYNYIFGQNALKADQDGTVSFDFGKAKDFCGGIGFITDNLASDGSQGFGVFVIQDRLEIGLDKDVYFIDDEGDMQYLGSFEDNVAMNIKLRKQGNIVEVIKNDFGGSSRVYDEPYIFHPFASPIFQDDKITRVTSDFGSPLQLLSSMQHPACNGNTLGSIDLTAIGGEPPYHYHWTNGDTIADPDSLGIGLYAVTVWDSQNDTIVDSLYVGYEVVWDTLINVDDSLGMLKSNGNNSTVSFNSYAYGLNSLAPGEDGWIEFVLPENEMFNGAVGMVANRHYDESSEGIAFNIVNDIMAVDGNMLENPELFGEYKTAAGYKLRIDFEGDNITLTKGDIFGFSPGRKRFYTYHRTEHWSPSVIFGLNGAQVASVSSSFGCGRMHVETRTEPASKDGSAGSIYTDIKGGVAPYTYTWSNSATTGNILNVPLGNYTVTVEDQLGDEQIINVFLGKYVDWDVLSGMAEIGTEVVYEGDTVDFDSTLVSFAFGQNAIKPGQSGTVSFDFERAADFTGAVGFAESADLSISQDGALAVVGLIEGDLYVLDESGNPAYFGKLRENLPVNIRFKKTPTEFEVIKNGLSSIFINTPTTGFLSPIVAPGFHGDKVHRITCDFGKRLKVVPDITPIECGTTNTGSIIAEVSGGIPPYTYYWNTGDTTDTNDSLIVGDYSVLVVDSIGDSTAAYMTMGYDAGWHTLIGVGTDENNSVSASIPFNEGNAYAVGASTLYPVVGESGWMEFKVDAGNPFNGYFGLVNEMTFDETMIGVGILIEDGNIYSSSTDPEAENMYLGHYNQSFDNIIRVTKLDADTTGGDGDSIVIAVNGIVVVESRYDYPSNFKPVIFLNSAKSKVRYLLSSFCNTYSNELLVLNKTLHVSSNHGGAIYLNVQGGNPPYKYAWSDITTPLDTVIDDYADSLISYYNTFGMTTVGMKEKIKKGYIFNESRYALSSGEYTVTVTDAVNRQVERTFFIGQVSKFMYTNTLSNKLGTITKTAVDGWTNNACISSLGCDSTKRPHFDYVVLDNGDFDFGFRDLNDSIITDSLVNFSTAEYRASEYYFIKLRGGELNYETSAGVGMPNITTVTAGDKISLYLSNNNVLLKKNDVLIHTAAREPNSLRILHSAARIYSLGSSFKIINNVIY